MLIIRAVMLLVLWLCAMVVHAGTIASDASLSMELVTVATGTPVWDADDGPGNDSSATNAVLRTQDVISYEVQFSTFGELQGTLLTLVLPKEMELEDIPPFCKLPASTISNDATTGRQTLLCHIAGNNPASDPDSSIKPASVLSLPLAVRALSRDRLGNPVPNGTVPTAPTATLSGTNAGTSQAFNLTSTSDSFSISARPRFDLTKRNLFGPWLRGLVLDETGKEGIAYQFPFLVKIDQGGKGTEMLAAPVNITDNFYHKLEDGSITSFPYRLLSWSSAYSPGCYPNYTTGKLNHSYAPRGSYYSSNPDQSVTESGTFNCSQASPGDPITITVTGADTSGNHWPTESGGGRSIPADERYVISGIVNLWVPIDYLEANGGVISVFNRYSELTAAGVSGLLNDESDTVNNDSSTFSIISTRGSFNSYYARDYAAGRGTRLEPMTSLNAGNGYVMPDQVFGKRIYGINNGALPWYGSMTDGGSGTYTGQGFMLCEKIDNRTYVLEPLASNTTIAHSKYQGSAPVNYVVEYGTGGSNLQGGTYYYDSDGDGDPLTNGQTGFTGMRATNCADADSPGGWHANIQNVPGGPAAVTKVRARALEPVPPNATLDVGLNLRALGSDPLSGEKILNGTLLPNFMSITGYNNAGSWSNGDYNPINHSGSLAYGDRLTLTRGIVRVDKITDPDDSRNNVLAGQTIAFRLIPSFSATIKPAPTLGYDVTVTDTLPPELAYVSSSASRVPDSVTVNPDGSTRIVWVFSNVLMDSTMPVITFSTRARFDLPNGTPATNTAVIESPADASRLGDRTDTRSITVGNSGAFSINKEAVEPLVEIGTDIVYRLQFANIGSNDVGSGDYIDLLPFIGDSTVNINDDPTVVDIVGSTADRDPPTQFTPNSNNKAVDLVSVTPSPAGETFRYTSQVPEQIFLDPSHSSNLSGGSTRWCDQSAFGTAGCPASMAAVTAIRIFSPAFPKNTPSREVTVTLSHNGHPAEVQSNSFGGRVNGMIGMLYTDSNLTMETPQLGVAKQVTVTGGPLPAPYTLTYAIHLQNLSPFSTLSDLTATEDLAAVFGQMGTDWQFVSLSKLSGPATLDVNSGFNGNGSGGDTGLLSGGSSLGAGELAQLQLIISMQGAPGVYNNQISAEGRDTLGLVHSDLSNQGAEEAIDSDRDGNANEMDTGGGAGADSNENTPTTATLYGSDFGDAPASYRTLLADDGPRHGLTADMSVYLGTTPPDYDPDGSPADTARLDKQEDAGLPLPRLSSLDDSYSLPVSCAGTGVVAGWIDLNRNGLFEDTERNANHPQTCTSGSVTLNWSGITPVPGSSYLRLRMASLETDVELPTGAAADGEVEDHELVIQPGANVSGRVFADRNVNASDEGEPGIPGVTLVLHDPAGNTCRSTRTDADGHYRFGNVDAGTYTVIEAAGENVPAPATCPPAPRDPADWLSSTNNSRTLTVTDADVSGIDFGDVEQPAFELDNQRTVLPGNAVTHPHVFRATSTGSVTFNAYTAGMSPAGADWGVLLFRDINCDAQLDAADTALAGALPLDAGDTVCLLVKVLAPGSVSTGASLTLEVDADFSYGSGTGGLANTVITHTDLTTVQAGSPVEPPEPAGGAGRLSLVKEVENLDRPDRDGALAEPGQRLRYTIRYHNTGNGRVNELVVHDSIPAFTTLSGTPQCGPTPPGLSCVPPLLAGPGEALDWRFSGPLEPGASGAVFYDVRVD